MLLRSPFGLPLIKRIFIPISISQALCAEGTARQTSSSSLRSWLLCVACNAVSLMFSIAHPNIRCIVILVKSVVFRPLYSAVLRHIYHNHIRSDLFDILIRNRIPLHSSNSKSVTCPIFRQSRKFTTSLLFNSEKSIRNSPVFSILCSGAHAGAALFTTAAMRCNASKSASSL